MKNFRRYSKAFSALFGSIATALLATQGPNSSFGTFLTIVAVVATAVGTWAVSNAE